jgi:YbgC/YbaW family acyl-CoA thioester hydrolase
MTPFRTTFTVKFRDADPAQIMYFGNLPHFAHDAFEEFIVATGYKYSEWFSKHEFMIPIRHLEVDYLAPLIPGQKYEISVDVAEIRQTSFKMRYTFSKNNKEHGIVKMVHTVLDSASLNKVSLPEIMRQRLSKFLVTVK